MGYLRQAKTEDEIKKLTVKKVKEAYNILATDYNKILDNKLIYCHKCNDHKSTQNFYTSNEYASGYFPICKQCCLSIAEQRLKKNDKPNETKESVQRLLQMMNLPYIDSLYESCCQDATSDVSDKSKKAPILQYISIIKSLPQYRSLTWKDSELPIDGDDNDNLKKVQKSTIRRFGSGLTTSDYLFLQKQYNDWVNRYECNTKAQEELFERLSFKKLELFKATREGKNTKDLDKSYLELMQTANITPRQNSMDAFSEGKTLGQLIEKWEVERPLPEIDESLRDVDRIGLYIDVFFKGHLAKLLNLKNPLQHIYEHSIKKYTVEKPEYDEDEDSEVLFDKIFGNKEL